MDAQEVLDFWFLPSSDPGHGQQRAAWFRKDDAFDAVIRERFGAAINHAIAGSSLTISSDEGRQEWRFVALALSRKTGAPLSELARELAAFDGVDSFQLSHARN